MRPLSEWDESDLLRLYQDDVQENLTLDYKESAALSMTDRSKKDISKDVSAFANSAGGRIVYGMKERGHHPAGLDDGSDPQVITREWLEQVISSTIHPRIHGLVIKPIKLANGNNAFVVDIPQTKAGGPHQANDQRYYRRSNFQSTPMHDYEVRDVMNRATSPLIEVQWRLTKKQPPEDNKRAYVEVSLQNHSNQPALYGSCTLYLDEDFKPDLNHLKGTWNTQKHVRLSMPGGEHSFAVSQRKFAVPMDQPIYKEVAESLGLVGMDVRHGIKYMIGWRFNCPGYHAMRWGTFDITPDGRMRMHWFDSQEEE